MVCNLQALHTFDIGQALDFVTVEVKDVRTQVERRWLASAPSEMTPLPGATRAEQLVLGGSANLKSTFLDSNALSASRILVGERGRLSSTHALQLRCKHERGLRIVILGGSVSCGRSYPTKAKQRSAPCGGVGGNCKRDAWPALLEAALNSGGGPSCSSQKADGGAAGRRAAYHAVSNLCQGAVGSDFWAGWISSWRSNPQLAPLIEADVVIVETALNDIDDVILPSNSSRTAASTSLAVLTWTEILVRQLLALPSRPALYWLAASWRPSYESAEAGHHTILHHYGLPHLSLARALQPGDDRPSGTVRRQSVGQGAPGNRSNSNSLAHQFVIDKFGHPSSIGQQLIADVVMWNLATDAERHAPTPKSSSSAREANGPSLPEPPAAALLPPTTSPLLSLPEPLAASPALIAHYCDTTAEYWRHDLRQADVVSEVMLQSPSSHGWHVREDVVAKPGLIATQTGSVAILSLLDQRHSRPPLASSTAGFTTIGFLASFADVGAFVATVFATPARQLPRQSRPDGISPGGQSPALSMPAADSPAIRRTDGAADGCLDGGRLNNTSSWRKLASERVDCLLRSCARLA